MPVARRPDIDTPNAGNRQLSTAVVAPDLDVQPQGTAVAVVDDGGQMVYRPVSATQYPTMFYGFLTASTEPNRQAVVTTSRGSLVTPRVEGVLVPGSSVFLSLVPGYVTCVAPSEEGVCVWRLGYAISASQMVLAPDPIFLMP